MKDPGKCPCGKEAVWHREILAPRVLPGYPTPVIPVEQFLAPGYCDECFQREVPEEEREGEENGVTYRWVKQMVG